MEIAPVDQRYIHWSAPQRAGRIEPAESAAEDDDALADDLL
jgi:hypothetical protein